MFIRLRTPNPVQTLQSSTNIISTVHTGLQITRTNNMDKHIFICIVSSSLTSSLTISQPKK